MSDAANNPEVQVPETVEQIALNNMVNIEALLEVLIDSGVVKEEDFHKAKNAIEGRIADNLREISEGDA